MPQLTEWESFYVIVGSSAAALTGLMFVVITLIADSPTPRSGGAIAAFGTPNIVHFCAALIVSATLSAPWHSLGNVGLVLGVAGLIGIIYCLVVARRARRQTEYRPVFEDWLWHSALPFGAYGGVVAGAIRLAGDAEHSLFMIAGAVLALVLIGIHNAWDTVTYLALAVRQGQDGAKG